MAIAMMTTLWLKKISLTLQPWAYTIKAQSPFTTRMYVPYLDKLPNVFLLVKSMHNMKLDI
jgi:hypothetical protein